MLVFFLPLLNKSRVLLTGMNVCRVSLSFGLYSIFLSFFLSIFLSFFLSFFLVFACLSNGTLICLFTLDCLYFGGFLQLQPVHIFCHLAVCMYIQKRQQTHVKDPVVHVWVQWIMETHQSNPACSKSISVFKMLKLDTRLYGRRRREFATLFCKQYIYILTGTFVWSL